MGNEVAWDLGCEFGKVNVGDKDYSLRVKVPREGLGIENADLFLLESKFPADLVLDQNAKDDGAGQQSFLEPENEVRLDVEVDGYSVKKTTIAFTVHIAKDDIEDSVINTFAKRVGRFKAHHKNAG